MSSPKHSIQQSSLSLLLARLLLFVFMSLGSTPAHAFPASPQLQATSRGTFVPETPGDARRIQFANGITIDTHLGEPSLAPELRIDSVPAGRPGYYLVQLDGPILASSRQALLSTGAEILFYLPPYAYLVRADASAMSLVADLRFVVWTGLYQPAYKLGPEVDLSTKAGPQRVSILLAPGESMADVAGLVESAGGRVLQTSTPSSRNGILQAEVDGALIVTLARSPGVIRVEPLCFLDLNNEECQWVLQTFEPEDRKLWDHGLTGEGQVLATADTGIRTDHNAFRDPLFPITDFGDYPTHRKIIAYQRAANTPEITFGDIPIHGTATSSTACGNDAPFGSDPRDGMAKDARIYFLDFGSDSVTHVPSDLNDLFILPYVGNAAGAARVMWNSWSGCAPNGEYRVPAMQVDQFMWEHKDFLLVFSAGNGRTFNARVGDPATAKDCLTAGGTLNGQEATTWWIGSLRGYTGGRRKPTVVTPAVLSTADASGTDGYAAHEGTSLSSATLAGTVLLARQYLIEGRYPTGIADPEHAFTPSAALLKAMTVNCGQADFTGFPGYPHLWVPSNYVGWGRPTFDDVLYFPGDSRQTLLVDATGGLLTGEYLEYQFAVSDTTLPLRISLVWTDYPGAPLVLPDLVNDLDLRVTGGGETYLGNTFVQGQSVPGGQTDYLNVEECVWRTTPAQGIWTVRVAAANVPMGPQPFALVVSGGLSTDTGLALLDRSEYAGGDTLRIRVEDLNALDPLSVEVTSTTEIFPETVLLSRPSRSSSGVFEAAFPTTLAGVTHGDGRLSVSQGDTIAVTYRDSSPVHGSITKAWVFLNPPTITSVGVSDIRSTMATVGWSTSVPASSRILYGTSPTLDSGTAIAPELSMTHSLMVRDLLEDTTYYFDVESRDEVGNTVRDDNGGAHYRFTSGRQGDILLVIGDETFGGTPKYERAFARTGWTFDRWYRVDAVVPSVGGLSGGLRSYRAVWWQDGWEQFPPFSDEARDSLARYNAGGGRLCAVSAGVAQVFGDQMGSSLWSPASEAWLRSELHVAFEMFATGFDAMGGIAGDPISGGYLSDIPYDFGSCAIHPVDGTGTASHVWQKTHPLPQKDVAVRWVAGSAGGSPDSALWGGSATKNVTCCLDWARLNPDVEDDTTRAGILDKTLQWLIGRDHPTVAVTAPSGGEILTGTTASISWDEALDGASVGTRKLQYSDDGGCSWKLITASAPVSPYIWHIGALPNGNLYRVRLTLVDDGTPTLAGQDASDGNFTINRLGGDTRGPVVVAGSMVTVPNPVVAPGTFSLRATIDDSRTGSSNIAAAEWNVGARALPPGSGTAMSGAFTTPVVAVRDTVDAGTLPPGYVPLWIRGRDAAGQWGPADSMTVYVNGGAATVQPAGAPAIFALEQNVSNPSSAQATIRFSLARPGRASLAIYDVNGRLVRRLVATHLAAGRHEARWDGRDGGGRQVASGVYFYRLEANDQLATRKMTLMR